MGVRLEAQAGCYYGDVYTIQIIDSNYSGAVVEFTTNLQESAFTFNGALKNRLKPINTTDFKFNLLVENDDHRSFWSDMAEEQEGRFFVKVYGSVEGDYGLRFVGHLIMDETFLQNTNSKQYIDLRASDGLFRLTDQEFKSDSNDQTNLYGNNIAYYEGYDTLLNIIFKCLQGVGTQDLYSASDQFLWINHEWYESNMDTTAGEASFAKERVNQRIFTEKDDEENYLTMTRAQVLEEILKAHNCKIRYVNGHYRLENINSLGNSGRNYRRYDKDGNHILNSAVGDTYTIDNSVGDYLALKGGKFGMMPPYKQACNQFNFKLGNYGYNPNYWDTTEDTLVEMGDVEVTSEETAILVDGIVNYLLTTTGTPNVNLESTYAHLYFGITIKFGSYYYITEVTQDTYPDEDQNGDPILVSEDIFENKWSTTPGVYLFKTTQKPIYLITGQWNSVGFRHFTIPLREILDPDPTPAYNLGDVDTLSVKIEFVKLAKKDDYEEDWEHDDPGASEWTNFDIEWNTYVSFFNPVEGTSIVEETQSAIKYCIENDTNNSTKVEVQTMIGDSAFNSNNRIEIYNGADWVGSGSSWNNGSIAGGGMSLQKLLVDEIVRGQQSSLYRYIGAFRGMPDPSFLIKYDNITWIPTQFEFRPYNRVYQGEWFQYRYNETASLTITSSGVKAENNGTLSTSIASGASDGNPASTQTIYPVKIQGAGSAIVDFGDVPLPDPSLYSAGQLEYLLPIYRGSVRLWYGSSSDMYSYTITDYANGEITMGRALRTDEYIKGHVIKENS